MGRTECVFASFRKEGTSLVWQTQKLGPINEIASKSPKDVLEKNEYKGRILTETKKSKTETRLR